MTNHNNNICCKGCFELSRAEAKKEADEFNKKKTGYSFQKEQYWIDKLKLVIQQHETQKSELIEKIKSLKAYALKEQKDNWKWYDIQLQKILDTFKQAEKIE
jgi:hypothetical protein